MEAKNTQARVRHALVGQERVTNPQGRLRGRLDPLEE